MTTARERGLQTMKDVYGWDSLTDGAGDFWGLTRDHLFAEIWNRPGLSWRDRRLLLIGMLTGRGDHEVTRLQIDGALHNGELSAEELREIVVFLAHYAGWPSGAALNTQVESAIARRAPKA